MLKKISEKSGGSIDDKFLDTFEEKTVGQKQCNYTSIDLLKYKNMRKITFIMVWGWSVTSMIYYGLSLNAGSLSGDIFANNALHASFELLGKVIKIFIIFRWHPTHSIYFSFCIIIFYFLFLARIAVYHRNQAWKTTKS